MSKILSILKDRYLIAGTIFVTWMLFFDRHDLATQYGYYSQLKDLEAEKKFYVEEIQKTTEGLDKIKNNAQEVQRIAREKYQMKKENEDVFILLYE